MPLAVVIAALAGCHRGDSGLDSPVVDTEVADTDDTDVVDTVPVSDAPIVVFITTDTLGYVAAEQTGWCARVRELAGAHGLDVACPEGAVAPSSWTAEVHSRLLYPQNLVGHGRYRSAPGCDEVSVFAHLAESNGGWYTFGADNPVLGYSSGPACSDGALAWHQGADEAWSYLPTEAGPQPEADTPVHLAIDSLLAATGRGEPAIAFLNAYEVGGHFPRCWYDPETPACSALWDLGVQAGYVAADDDRVDAWLNHPLDIQIAGYVGGLYANHPEAVRDLWWETMTEAIAYHRVERFDDRLERVLAGIDAQGRIGDLTLVIVGDHGENPCTVDDLGNGRLNCTHTGLVTEFTGIVPVFVAPASRATRWADDGYIGDADHPWSTVNLAYALMDLHGAPIPGDWPPMQPVGTATAWTCLPSGQLGSSGVRVVGDVSLRCEGAACGAWNWRIPPDEAYEPTRLDAVPDEVADYEGEPTWFQDACVPWGP
jgi:hypothetical protein